MSFLCTMNEFVNMDTSLGSEDWIQQMRSLSISDNDIKMLIDFNKKALENMSGGRQEKTGRRQK